MLKSLINMKYIAFIWSYLVKRIYFSLTLGSRVAVFDDDNRVLLVRHSYINGWYFPGGGVDPGETLEEAAGRELIEETDCRPIGPLIFKGIYFNSNASRRDHVGFFECRNWEKAGVTIIPNAEIREVRFFALDDLPGDISPGTRRRLDELAGQSNQSSIW